LPIFINWTPGAGVEPPPACHLPCGFATGPLPNSHATFNSWLNGWKRVNLSMFLVNLFTFQSHLIVILAQCMDKTAPLNDLQSLQYTVIASDLLPAASRSGRGIAVSSDWDWTPQLPERAILYVSTARMVVIWLFYLDYTHSSGWSVLNFKGVTVLLWRWRTEEAGGSGWANTKLNTWL
jgi:hypothetical protein